MRFSTEEFVGEVIADVERDYALDASYIFAMGWSTSGTAVYSCALEENSRITGSFIAMSVFKPLQLPALDAAKGRPFYLLHSPEDRIPIRMAEQALVQLRRKKANVKLVRYQGGHGWRGDVKSKVQAGIDWLERKHARQPRRVKTKE